MHRRPLLALLVLPLLATATRAETDADSTTVTMPVYDVVATRIQAAPEKQPYAFYRQDRTALDLASARSLTDRLQYSPGVIIQHTAPNQSSPFIRGLTGEQTLLMFDGVRYSHAAMRPGPNQYTAMIADESIGSVDILLGGSSVVTGSDGLTGAIDFRLAAPGRQVASKASPFARLRTSTTEGTTTAAGLDGTFEDWSYSVEGSWADFQDIQGGENADRRVTDLEDGRIPNTGFSQFGWAGRAAYRGIPGQRFEVAAGQTRQEDAPRPDGYAENSGRDSRISRYFDPQEFTYAHLRHTSTPASRWFDSTAVTAWYHQHAENQFREDIRDGDSYRRRELDDAIDVLGVDIQATSLATAEHAVTYGLTFSHETTENAYRELRADGSLDPDDASAHNPGDWNTLTTIPDGATYTSLGVFAQDRWQFHPKAQLVAGARFSRYAWTADATGRGYSVDEIDGDASNLSGSVRMLVDVADRETVFGGVSQGFRAPNLTNLTGRQDRGSSGVFFQGSPDLDPEKSVSFELGWRSTRDPRLSVSLFRTHVDDLIQRVFEDADNDGTVDPIQRNAESAVLQGFELSGNLDIPAGLPGDWSLALLAVTSYVDATVDVPQEDGSVREDNISRANRWVGRVGLRLAKGQNWWIQPRARLSADYDEVASRDAGDVRMTVAGAEDGSMAGFIVADVLGGWRSSDKRHFVVLTFENVLDKTYRDVGSGVDGPGRGLAIELGTRY